MTDAVHILADVVGILFSLLALWLSTKPPSKRYTFGLHRLGKVSHFSSITTYFHFPLFTEVIKNVCSAEFKQDPNGLFGLGYE